MRELPVDARREGERVDPVALSRHRDAFNMQIPFEVIDGRIYVQVMVNGRGPFRFALDTGASGLGSADASLEVRVSARYPELLVGAHALQRFVVLIDQRSRSVAVCR